MYVAMCSFTSEKGPSRRGRVSLDRGNVRKLDGEEVSESFHSPGPVEDSRLRRKLEGEEERELQQGRLVEGELLSLREMTNESLWWQS